MIDANGTIKINTWWGLYVDEGTNKDKFLVAYYDTTLEPANGFIYYHVPDSDALYGYNVRIEQTFDNVVTVKNFANYGLSIDVDLNTDGTAIVQNSVVANIVYNGALQQAYPISQLQLNDAGALQSAVYGISCTVPEGKKNELVWGSWSMMVPSVVWFGARTDGRLVWTDGQFQFPTTPEANFEGEGTAESPYLVKTLEDLSAMAYTVNSSEDLDYANVAGSKYARVYLGKHFRLENDIDMSSTRFTPIGCDWQHRFAGSFDGNGHKLTGLNEVCSGSYGFGGLFGAVDTTTVIKNLTMVDPVIDAVHFTGAIVGWNLGDISDCKVINPSIFSTKPAVGGVVGAQSGHTVKNCSVEGGTVTGLGGFVGGVIGEASCTSATSSVGEVAGKVENCYATGTVVNANSDSTPVGGVVGNCHTADMTNCYFMGTVNGQYRVNGVYSNMIVGGVAGTLFRGTITNCFAVGDVIAYGSSARIGGVVGLLRGKLVNCYATGRVYGYSSKSSGSLAGYVSPYIPLGATENVKVEVTNCYTATQSFAETYMINNNKEHRELIGQYGETTNTADTLGLDNYATITNAYYNKQLTNYGGSRFAASTAELTSATGPTGFTASDWVFEQGAYPRLKGMSDTQAAYMSASAVDFTGMNSADLVMSNTALKALGNTRFMLVGESNMLTTNGTYATIENNNMLKTLEEVGTETLVLVNGSVQYPITLKISPMSLEGSGSEEDPFQVKTKDDLIKISKATTGAGQLFPGVHFKMMNDIDLELDANFLGICADANDAHNQFEGVFDGGNYTIHHMKIRGLVFEAGKSPSEVAEGVLPTVKTGTGGSFGYQGFMGRMAPGGVLKNIRFAADCDGVAFATMGMAVGYLYGTVENVRNYADVTAYSCWVGGLVGQAMQGAVIRNCFNAGNVTTGYNSVGGIVGRNDGLVENCANVGNVTAVRLATNFANQQNLVGGISGSTTHGQFVNVFNAGEVYAQREKCGGIVGQFSASSTGVAPKVTSALNIGIVTATNIATLGAVFGNSEGNGTAQNAYYDGQIIPYGASNNTTFEGIKGLETTALTSGTAIEGLANTAWDYAADSYPVLKEFADEPSMVAVRKMIVTMPSGTNANDLRGTSKLAQIEGMTWKLAQDTVYSITDGGLVAPSTVDEPVENTLICTYKDMTKNIPISTKPSCPVAGEGTEASPWLIANAAEWVKMTQWQQIMLDDFTDRYVKLTADIDFAETDFEPFGSVTTPFNGTFDGDGKTVSNIEYAPKATYEGLFIKVNAAGVIKNITFQGDVNVAFNYVGGVVGALYGTLDNVTSNMNIKISDGKSHGYLGGCVGYAYSGSTCNKVVFKGTLEGNSNNYGGIVAFAQADTKFVDCGNEGTVSSTYTSTAAAGAATNIGGIAGQSQPGTYIRCYNKGTLKGSAAGAAIGGLIGYANGVANVDPYEFTECWNEADITGYANVGGLVATTGTSSPNTKMTVTGCYNTGDIYTNSAKAVSGSGTAGLFAQYVLGSTFLNCYNTGKVTSDMSVYTGGILGNSKGSGNATTHTIVRGCYNEGEIVAKGNQGGGIVAYAGAYVNIDSCYNVGPIHGNMMLGGITSALSGNSTIDDCWNTGEVVGLNQVGGICSWATANTAKINKCWNSGRVEATATGGDVKSNVANGWSAGGIIARASIAIEDCYNTGSVTGASRVGGIVGEPTKGTKNANSGVVTPNTVIRRCYNAGAVTARIANASGDIVEAPDSCGYIIGTGLYGATTATTTRWNEYNICEDTYYLTDAGTKTSLESVGTGVDTAQLCGANPYDDEDNYVDLGEAYAENLYCLPTLKGFCATDDALVSSIRAFTSAGDELALITPETTITTETFTVGSPAGATWSFAGAKAAYEGENIVRFTEAYTGDFTATATIGEATKTFNLKADVTLSALSDVELNREILAEKWYTVAGYEVKRPEVKDGNIYIVTFRYTDGTSETLKIINR